MIGGSLLRKVVITGAITGALVWAYTPTRIQVKKVAQRFKKDLEEREEELTKALLSPESSNDLSHRPADL